MIFIYILVRCVILNSCKFVKYYFLVMETPKRKNQIKKVDESNLENGNNTVGDGYSLFNDTSTPNQNRSGDVYDEYSPLYVQCTQEAFDQLDVVWDWNSPQSKPKEKKLKQRRIHVAETPKIPAKKHHFKNHPPVNDNIKIQLEALKNQLKAGAKGSATKTTTSNDTNRGSTIDVLKDFEEFFNDDSMEEELILQSQKVESLVKLELKESTCDISINYRKNNNEYTTKSEFRKVKSEHLLNTSSSNTLIAKSVSSTRLCGSPKQISNVPTPSFSNKVNDSFELALESFKEGDLNNVNISVNFNSAASNRPAENLTQFELEEIERRRLEAVAKLRAKKIRVLSPSKISPDNAHTKAEKKNLNHNYQVEDSPIKCSPEEIEQKRLDALAKLEAKKKQEIIEKNRLEALKRLQMNKKKRQQFVKNINS